MTFITNVQTWLRQISLAGAATNISAADQLIKNGFPHLLIMPPVDSTNLNANHFPILTTSHVSPKPLPVNC